MELQEIVNPLLDWYETAKRDLPWRRDPSFYHVWLSEIMLQQTRVQAVKEYYQRFLTRLPTIHDLATVPVDELLKLWEGLGYYNRARNLQKAAQVIETTYGGIPPHDYETLLTLPGIGEYTAGAIASICYQEKVPAIDGNVLRVMMRLMNDSSDITLPATKKTLFQTLQNILPAEVGDFNQALMELGALICLPNGEPKCAECPLHHICLAHQHQTVLSLPVKTKKKARRTEKKTVLLMVQYNQVALLKRPATGLLAGLWMFPLLEGHQSPDEVLTWIKDQGLYPIRILELDSAKHIFTHLEWNMKGYVVFVSEVGGTFTWASHQELRTKYAIPTAVTKYQEALEEVMHQNL